MKKALSPEKYYIKKSLSEEGNVIRNVFDKKALR